MERARRHSGGWSRPNPQRVATVKPVSKSFSVEDLSMEKSTDSGRVLKRFKSQDLADLKKDSLIEELEKCLGELETEHKTSEQLNEVYETVEAERNQLLDELELAFQDLREYMRRQTMVEEQKALIEEERNELAKENAYLKEVLSNRSEIMDRKVTLSGDEKRKVQERVVDLERKNAELVDEINTLYEERQTLIASLVGLHSEQVDTVLRQRSRSGSVSSTCSSIREGLDVSIRLDDAEETIAALRRELEQTRSLLSDVRKENEDLTMAFSKLRSLDAPPTDSSSAEEWQAKLAEKDKELEGLREEFADQKLLISKMNNEKRGFQRQIDHLREETRRQAAQTESTKKESDNAASKLRDAEKWRQASEKETQKLQQRVDEMSAKIQLQELDMLELKVNKEVDKVETELESENRRLIVQLEGLRMECSSIGENYKDMESKFATIQGELEAVVSERERMVAETSILRAEMAAVRDAKDLLQSEMNGLSQELEMAKVSVMTLEGRCSDLELALREKIVEVESFSKLRQSESMAAAKEIERLQSITHESLGKLSAMEGAYQQAVQGKSQMEEAIKRAEDALNERDSALNKALAELRKLDKLASQFASLKQEKEGLERELKKKDSQLQEAALQLDKLKVDSSETKRDLKTCSDHCVELEKTLKVKLDDLDRLSKQSKEYAIAAEEQLAKLRSDVDGLTRRASQLEGENTALVGDRAASEKHARETSDALQVKQTELEVLRQQHLLLQDVVEEQRLKLKDLAVVSCEYETLKQKQCAEGDRDVPAQRRIESMKKENERLLAKCRSLEKVAADVVSANAELAHVKDENKMLLDRYRFLEKNSEEKFSLTIEKERAQYAALLAKYRSLVEETRLMQGSCVSKSDADPMTVRSKASEIDVNQSSLIQELSASRCKITSLESENADLHSTIEELKKAGRKQTCVVLPESRAHKSKIGSLETSVARLEAIARVLLSSNSDRALNGVASDDDDVALIGLYEHRLAELCRHFETVEVLLRNMNDDLITTRSKLDTCSTQLEDLKRECDELHQQKLKVESDYKYILQSHREEAQARLASRLSHVEQEKTSLHAKYDQVRVELEKIRREKEHFVATVENLREDNGKLREQVKRQRMSSNSAVELLVTRLKDEKDALARRCDALQLTLTQANAENRSLLERLSQSEESMTTTIRSLKARKSELQAQLEKCKHEHVIDARGKQSGEVSTERTNLGSITGYEEGSGGSATEENLRNAQAKVAELDFTAKEYARKLQESESLLSDLQKALAQANDLAMQKSLEATRTKRNLERRLEKLLRENVELKQLLAAAAQSHVPYSSDRPSSATGLSRFEFHSVGELTSPTDVTSERLASPVPILASSRPLGRQVSGDGPRASQPGSPVASPRVVASRRLEQDLTKQLRDLLDMTNDMGVPREEPENARLNESVESVGPPKPPPPKPPPPTYYGQSDRRVKSASEHSPEPPLRPMAVRTQSGAPSLTTASRGEVGTTLNRWPEFDDLVAQSEVDLVKGIVMYRC